MVDGAAKWLGIVYWCNDESKKFGNRSSRPNFFTPTEGKNFSMDSSVSRKG
jgi:hypothetical protein